ncbi:MAG: thioredoxin fold domain-containing protein [Pseudomonadota bacterium]
MIKPLIQAAALTTFSLLGLAALAEDAVDQEVVDAITSALANPAMGLEVSAVEASPIPGLYQVAYASGPVVYSTATGDYVILGDLYSVGADGYTNLTAKRLDGARATALAEIDEKDMIIFAPEGETIAQITVFTDTTCFYCQKLHREVPELNKRGVAVRYLAYPRAGVGSPGYEEMVTAWCAQDKQDTLTKLKDRQTVPQLSCEDNPVEVQYGLGQQMGVQGTPAMVMDDGTMIPGYQSADDLMTTMGLQ